MIKSCALKGSPLRALVPLQLQELWLRSTSGPLLLNSSTICAHLRPIIIVSSDKCQCFVSCSRSSCQKTCHDACSWQVFISSMVPVLHISTNTRATRGAGRIIMSPERKTAGRWDDKVVTTYSKLHHFIGSVSPRWVQSWQACFYSDLPLQPAKV